ncbi:MAG: hypothetical protein COZ06_19825 [Armatimonadetes bacterium CG_4_10_14_3_um_filter_66_18]|nr:MAG: hypothetical protein COS65_27290 [Armatimonadetes bacterium CG06_land_8_20_14_3_00_66_21]PIY44740.1 MAG: hypothetical protein COZ06_19825 [Armatimonadetes bacterium CG_4_10_14_3_um_filter_66_18]PIZ48859.1 MAG: hypothetical protein COY42_05470 [Armatimonadetes bacterium CG_4_10_14_0_8_um_filter_66_14]PJB64788.1 MAG: hypothetical protein CO096_19405 [Armatimonadetes bacterium CG_4_9_14_3_um_filter_66_14]
MVGEAQRASGLQALEHVKVVLVLMRQCEKLQFAPALTVFGVRVEVAGARLPRVDPPSSQRRRNSWTRSGAKCRFICILTKRERCEPPLIGFEPTMRRESLWAPNWIWGMSERVGSAM